MTRTVVSVRRGQPLPLGQGLGPVDGDRFVQEDGQFGEVGRNQVCEGQQGLQCGLGGILQEPVAAGGHHHRIQHHHGGADPFQPGVDRLDDRSVGQHADFDGIDADVVADRVELGGQEVCGRDVDSPHAPGVLRSEGSDGGHAVAAVRGDAFQVRLDPGTAGGVRAGDGQHPGNPDGRCCVRGVREKC